MASWKVLRKSDMSLRKMNYNTRDLQTERLVHVFAALAAVEEVLLDVVSDGEQVAASGVRGCVHTIGASNTPGDST